MFEVSPRQWRKFSHVPAKYHPQVERGTRRYARGSAQRCPPGGQEHAGTATGAAAGWAVPDAGRSGDRRTGPDRPFRPGERRGRIHRDRRGAICARIVPRAQARGRPPPRAGSFPAHGLGQRVHAAHGGRVAGRAHGGADAGALVAMRDRGFAAQPGRCLVRPRALGAAHGADRSRRPRAPPGVERVPRRRWAVPTPSGGTRGSAPTWRACCSATCATTPTSRVFTTCRACCRCWRREPVRC